MKIDYTPLENTYDGLLPPPPCPLKRGAPLWMLLTPSLNLWNINNSMSHINPIELNHKVTKISFEILC